MDVRRWLPIHISSIAGQSGIADSPTYSASKAAIDSLSRTQATAFGRRGLFDENGNNAEIEYLNLSTPRHTPPSVAVDGTRVTGEGILLRHASNDDWGDAVNVVFDFHCG